MRDVEQPSVRIHRVTTRRRSLRALQCPLEPELLVAEFAGELPPDVALAVREHIAVCETCGARSQVLRSPYELLASLGNEPVPHVPDLRDAVRQRARHGAFFRRVLRAAGVLGRGGALGGASVVGLIALIAALIAGVLYSVNAQPLTRSANGLSGVPAAAASGELLAETDKVIAVKDATGRIWQVAEVIAVDERTGAVRRSLPRGAGALHTAQSGQMPLAVAVAPDGSAVYELTAPDGRHRQALVAVDTVTGALKFVTALALPGKTGLPANSFADALAVARSGYFIYVGLNISDPNKGGVRVLTLDTMTASVQASMSPIMTSLIPLPPPANLPAGVPLHAVPTLDASKAAVAPGAGGELALSPDGAWLFDLLLLQMPDGARYGVVRRISTLTGQTAQELALAGDFALAHLTSGSGGTNGEVVLVKGSPDARCFVLDAGPKGPLLLGDVALGGPASPGTVRFSGALSASVSADGHQLYITQNASSEDGQVEGHDLWALDIQGMVVLAHRVDASVAADAVLANGAAAGASGQPLPVFIVQNGSVLLLSASMTGEPTPWLSLGDGHPVTRLLGTIPTVPTISS